MSLPIRAAVVALSVAVVAVAVSATGTSVMAVSVLDVYKRQRSYYSL